MDLPISKDEWRRRIRAARASRPHDPADASAIAEHVLDLEVIQQACKAGAAIACYAARNEEPPTTELRSALRAAGARVLLPRVDGSDLVWIEEDTHTELIPNRWAIPEPSGAPSDQTPAAWVIPALAIDQDGYRLGQGGGYYDRALADLPDDSQEPVIAIVFEDEVVAELPRENHDHPVDVAVTPERVRWLAMPD